MSVHRSKSSSRYKQLLAIYVLCQKPQDIVFKQNFRMKLCLAMLVRIPLHGSLNLLAKTVPRALEREVIGKCWKLKAIMRYL